MGWLMGHRGLGEQNRRVGGRLAGDERQRGTGGRRVRPVTNADWDQQ